ncbi:MAG TPA: hypothetical protein DIT48_10280 [Actinobacteria bacterium]|nr:hypothetical protein [Actinomycetota bacterium]HCP62805.1 hypothetical protein [Actinomycetota bacterium]
MIVVCAFGSILEVVAAWRTAGPFRITNIFLMLGFAAEAVWSGRSIPRLRRAMLRNLDEVAQED